MFRDYGDAYGENGIIFVVPATLIPRQASLPCVLVSIRSHAMVKVAFLVRLEAKPGQESAVENFLKSGLALVNQESFTPVWFALKIGPSTFGIFDAFADDSGRKAHLAGQLAAALMAKAGELLAQPPRIEEVDVLAVKLAS
jgi:quinol monooxygenase YgiN